MIGRESDLSVIPMDNYLLVRDMDFIDRYRAISIFFSNTLILIDEQKTYSVLVVRKEIMKGKSLSAMQLSKGLQREESIFVAS